MSDLYSAGSPGPGSFLLVHRGEVVAVAVVGLVLGIVALVWPDATLTTIAIIFGIYLVASGIFRITVAVLPHPGGAGLRWLSGILGLLVTAAGVFCLASPEKSLVVIAFVIGFGWIMDGIVDFMLGLRSAIRPRWFGFVSGIISIAAGVAMFVLPATGIETLVFIGSALLIVVSVTTLLTIPRKAKATAGSPATA